MTTQKRKPTPEILAARRALEGLAGVRMLLEEGVAWDDAARKWVVPCRLTPGIEPNEFIPASTDWYVLMDASYPWGGIKVHPAKKGGIRATYPHQMYNREGPERRPWRDGNICVETPLHILGRVAYPEPFGAHGRLRWYVLRALEWLRAASRGELVAPGEISELPDFSPGNDTVAFSEDQAAFEKWQNTPERSGIVRLSCIRRKPSVWVVLSFSSAKGGELFSVPWGQGIQKLCTDIETGICLRIISPPVLRPYQAPGTWAEFIDTCESQGLKIHEFIRPLAPKLRDDRRHVALVGFPTPLRAGGLPRQMHWQAMLLPVFSGPHEFAKGFRPTEQGRWRRDRFEVLCGKAEFHWLRSENWHMNEISQRGKLQDALTKKSILVIGAGSMGSVVAELLIRGGAQRLTLMDPDILKAGNLVRHTLLVADVDEPKAKALAARLRQASLHVSVDEIESVFPPETQPDNAKVQGADVVIDCTGSDQVLHELGVYQWGVPKDFFSVSVGFRSQRLFLFCHHGDRFPDQEARRALQRWLESESSNYGGDLPREGVGCWHPIFPARIDDIWLMASVAVKYVERRVLTPASQPELAVYEQKEDQDGFSGLTRVSSPEAA